MSAGVDTVGISFPIRGAELAGATVSISGYGTLDEKQTYRRALPGGGFLAWGVGDFAWVEASLPKRVGLGNVEALGADDAVGAIRDMYGEALNYVEADIGMSRQSPHVYSSLGNEPQFRHRSWETASVKRLDLVRDFDGITSIDALLNGLATIRQGGRSKVRRFADSERGLAETLRVGPKSWAATLYDKHVESGAADKLRRHVEAVERARKDNVAPPAAPVGLAEPGRLRFEARLRTRQLMSKHAIKLESPIALVQHITAEKVHTMTSATFQKVGFDREVAGTAQLAATVNAAQLSPREKREIVGYLAARAIGIELEFSSNTERKYRNIAKDLGIVVSEQSLSESFTARLDFETGTQVLTAA